MRFVAHDLVMVACALAQQLVLNYCDDVKPNLTLKSVPKFTSIESRGVCVCVLVCEPGHSNLGYVYGSHGQVSSLYTSLPYFQTLFSNINSRGHVSITIQTRQGYNY